MDNKGDFFAGIVVGTVIGAVLGIVLAPATGSDTRQAIAEKGKEVGSVAVDKMKEKSEVAIETAKSLIATIREKLPGSEELRGVLDTMEHELNS